MIEFRPKTMNEEFILNNNIYYVEFIIYTGGVMKNLLRFFLFLVLISFISVQVSAQAPDFNWVKQFGSTGVDIGHSIAVDQIGNTYLTGEFAATVSFGGDILTSAGNVDFYLVKMDTLGNPIWAKRGGGTLTDRGYGLTLDEVGNIYVTGHYFGAADFSGTNLTSAGNLDNIVAKYDNAGNLIWIRDGKSVSQVSSRGIALDDNANVFIAGYFGSTTVDSVNFDGFKILTNGGRDIFLAKYNNAGEIQWAQSAGSSSSGEEGRGLTIDLDGNPIMVGIFVDTANFGGTQLFSNGGSDIFIAKFNTSGTLLWVKNAGGPGTDAADGVGIDSMGNIYVTGYFDSTATFGTTQITGVDGDEMFLAKYDPDGNLIWVRSAGGSLTDRGNDLTVTPGGYSYIAGRFNGTAVFDTITVVSAGGDDIFVAYYDPSGDVEWVHRAGGTALDYGNAITVDIVGNCYISGYFRETALFDTMSFVSAGGQDIFVAKIGDVTIPVELISFNAEIVNNNVHLSWTTATELNNSGFDIERSTDKYNFNKIGFVEGKGTTTETNSYSFIDGTVSNGTYSYRLKQIDFDGSFAYSSIIEVSTIIPGSFNISDNYPNPFNPTTNIRFNLPVESKITLKIFNSLGELVYGLSNLEYSAGTHILNINAAGFSSGVYFYSVQVNGADGSSMISNSKMVLLK